MSSLLAPVCPNIYMGFYESKCLNGYNFNKTKLYIRYTYDFIGAFEDGLFLGSCPS